MFSDIIFVNSPSLSVTAWSLPEAAMSVFYQMLRFVMCLSKFVKAVELKHASC